MGRAEKRGREREHRKRTDKGNFIQRNWMKIALPTLGVVTATGIATGVLLSRDSKPPLTEQQSVERVLSISKQRIGECYDNAYMFWQTSQGTVDCKPSLSRMFREIGETTGIGFGEDLQENAGKLKGYLEQNGIFLDFLQLTSRGQIIPNFFISQVAKEAKERLKLADGEAEINVVYIGAPVVGNFVEEKLSTAENRITVKELTRDGKVYVRTDDSLIAARDLWDLYERADYRNIINNAKSQMQFNLSTSNIGEFYTDVQFVLQMQEWEDLHASVKKSGKGREEFARLLVAAESEIRKYHGARHEVDIRNNNNYSDVESERRAKLEEFLALKGFPTELMYHGYSSLGDGVFWSVSPSASHKKAGKEVIGCFTGTIDNNRTYFPQLTYKDSPTPKERELAIMQQFPSLTGDQIYDIGRACWEALYGAVNKTSSNQSYSHSSSASVWTRNEARFSRDLRSRVKAYLPRHGRSE